MMVFRNLQRLFKMVARHTETEDNLVSRQRQKKDLNLDKNKSDKDKLTDTSLYIEDTEMVGFDSFGCICKSSLLVLTLIAIFFCGSLAARLTSSSPLLDDDVVSRKLIDEIKAENIDAHLKQLTLRPHVSGSVNEDTVVEYIHNFWNDIKLDTVNVVSYDVLVSNPNSENKNYISVLDRSGQEVFKTFSEEPPLGASGAQVLQAFNAYSASVTVQGPLVYVNYGRLSDFNFITKNKAIDLNGNICLVRYGFVSRANKVKSAHKYGCMGVILFSDPDDFVKNMTHKTYPESWWLPGKGVQRGTLKDSSGGQGDPLTPAYPSTPEAYRIPQKDAILPKIPCQPIGYDDARHLLRSMDGEEVPPEWRGLLNVTYRFGPAMQPNIGNIVLSVNNEWKQAKISNIIGYVRGAVEPDRYVMIGNHHDAWVYGGTDPNSGTSVMLEVSRAVMELVKSGDWRPRRTIVFCSWGAEEQGLIGSREFVEQYQKILSERAVAYLNVDSAVQGRFVFLGKALPLLNNVMFEATKKVRNPNADEYREGRTSVYDTWLHRTPDEGEVARPSISRLGSGSDYASFVSSIGVPSTDIRFFYDRNLNISSYPLYHTSYDNYHMFSTFHDPGFIYSKALGQVWVEMVRILASPPILPLKTTQYSESIVPSYNKFVTKFENVFSMHNIYLGNLSKAFSDFNTSTVNFDIKLHSINTNNPLVQRQYNDQMMQLERSFIDYMGLPGRPLIRHVIFAPLASNSYGSSVFPGLSDAIQNLLEAEEREDGGNVDDKAKEVDECVEMVKKQVAVLTFFIKTASVNLQSPLNFAL